MGASEELQEAIKELRRASDKLASVFQLSPLPQPTIMEPQSHSQGKEEEGLRSEVHSKVATQPEAAVNGKKNRSRFFISSAEIFARWDKGLCTWCDELYFPGHKCTKIDPDTVFEIVEEEDLQLDVGVKKHPVEDAPQVFDESPRPNSDEGKQQGNAQPSSEENSDLYVQEASSEEAHSDVGMDEEFSAPADHSKALDLKVLFAEQNTAVPEQNVDPICPEMQVEYSRIMEGCSGQRIDFALDGLMPLFKGGRKCWFHSGKEAIGFSLLVYDPGKSGAGQATPKPTSLVFMYAWLGEIFAASKLSVVQFAFDPGEEMATTVFSSDPGKLVSWQTSAQVIAEVAGSEGPREEWPDLIGSLLHSMTQADSSASLKQATLETVGYVCEEIFHQELEQNGVNAILNDVKNLARDPAEKRLAATKALYNALGFAQTNCEIEMGLDYIMKIAFETATSQEVELRQTAYECLVAIASMHYEAIEPYVQTLFELTSKAVKEVEETVALQVMGFWSSICAEELEIQESIDLQSGQPEAPHSRLIEKALAFLVPMLLETLLKQEGDQHQDDNTWSLLMAGGTCLGLVARATGDIIVPLVMPFVEANITSSEWRCREAATYAFASILEGPNIEKLFAQGFEDVKSSSFDLTLYLTKIIVSLIATSGSTLNKVVRCAKVLKTAQIIQHLLLAVMNKMSRIFDPPLDKEKQGELQALLCAVLQVIIQKLSNCDETRHVVLQVADQIMVLLLKILACCSSTVHEEAMFSMRALAYATGSDFGKYMPEFYKNLDDGVAGGWFTAHVSSCGPFHSIYHSAPESVNSELRTMDSQLCQDDMPMVRRSAVSNLAKLAADMDEAGLIAVEILGAFKLAVVRLMFDPGGEFSTIVAEFLKLGVKLLEGEAMIQK